MTNWVCWQSRPLSCSAFADEDNDSSSGKLVALVPCKDRQITSKVSRTCAKVTRGEKAFAKNDCIAVSAIGDQAYSLKRYVNETRRLYRTMNKALAKTASGYLVGDHVSIADIAIWPWATAFSKLSEPIKTKGF